MNLRTGDSASDAPFLRKSGRKYSKYFKSIPVVGQIFSKGRNPKSKSQYEDSFPDSLFQDQLSIVLYQSGDELNRAVEVLPEVCYLVFN
jgi:hypothetical protein